MRLAMTSRHGAVDLRVAAIAAAIVASFVCLRALDSAREEARDKALAAKLTVPTPVGRPGPKPSVVVAVEPTKTPKAKPIYTPDVTPTPVPRKLGDPLRGASSSGAQFTATVLTYEDLVLDYGVSDTMLECLARFDNTTITVVRLDVDARKSKGDVLLQSSWMDGEAYAETFH